MNEMMLNALAREVLTGDHDSFVVLCDLLGEGGDLVSLRLLREEGASNDLNCLERVLTLGIDSISTRTPSCRGATPTPCSDERCLLATS